MRATGRRRPGRPRRLTTAVIADAVLAEGFRDLRLTAVAERLGVNHATLYRYVTSRDDLVRLAMDRLLATATWPSPDGPWAEYLESTAWTLWRLLRGHAGLATALAGGPLSSPEMIRVVNRVGTRLLDQGFSAANATLALDLVFDLVADTARQAERLADTVDDPSAARLMAEWDRHLDAGLRVLADSALHGNPDDRFAGKLAVVLYGVRHRLAPDT